MEKPVIKTEEELKKAFGSDPRFLSWTVKLDLLREPSSLKQKFIDWMNTYAKENNLKSIPEFAGLKHFDALTKKWNKLYYAQSHIIKEQEEMRKLR